MLQLNIEYDYIRNGGTQTPQISTVNLNGSPMSLSKGDSATASMLAMIFC